MKLASYVNGHPIPQGSLHSLHANSLEKSINLTLPSANGQIKLNWPLKTWCSREFKPLDVVWIQTSCLCQEST